MSEPPPNRYGEWTRGNTGHVGRCVTTFHESSLLPGEWMPVVAWEPHPDEPNDHKAGCHCASCELMAETRNSA